MTTGVETERKYDVPEAVAMPDLATLGYAIRVDRFTLTADYYDTVDHVLAANRVTLRRREGGHDAGWHLKTPGDDGRLEHQVPLDDDSSGSVPAALVHLVSDLVLGAEILPVVRLETDRTATTLSDGGEDIAEIADDRVTGVRLDVGETRHWREWEAELMAGAPSVPAQRAAVLDRIEAHLTAAGAVPSTAASKLARALGRQPLPQFGGTR